jgi:hypothetical protein
VPNKAKFPIGEQHFPTKIDIAYASYGDFVCWYQHYKFLAYINALLFVLVVSVQQLAMIQCQIVGGNMIYTRTIRMEGFPYS